MPCRSQIRMIQWVRAAVRSWARPGRVGESYSSRPAGSVTTCTFTPCRRCLWEWSARPPPTRSHSARVPSSRTYSASAYCFISAGSALRSLPDPGKTDGESVTAVTIVERSEDFLRRWRAVARYRVDVTGLSFAGLL
jgi:hypothetical protein